MSRITTMGLMTGLALVLGACANTQTAGSNPCAGQNAAIGGAGLGAVGAGIGLAAGGTTGGIAGGLIGAGVGAAGGSQVDC